MEPFIKYCNGVDVRKYFLTYLKVPVNIFKTNISINFITLYLVLLKTRDFFKLLSSFLV